MDIKHITKSYSDHCPHADVDYEIEVDINCIKQLGNDHEDRYIVGYSCDNSDNCSYHHRDECPVIASAKENLIL